MDLSLPDADLQRSFPFLIGVDREGRVQRRGPSLERLVPDILHGAPLLDHVTVRRPVGSLNWTHAPPVLGNTYVLQTACGLRLRGHWAEQPDGYLFLGSPAVTSLEEVRARGLKVRDFAPHDSSVDALFLLQSRDAALADARELQAHLEARRDELTRAYDELREQQDAVAIAVRESAEKSSFLAGMSHELRTPLNAILGYTELLLDDEATPDPLLARHGIEAPPGDLQRIHRAAHQLLGLINDILDIAKVEAGRLELHPEPTDLRVLLAAVRETVDPLARQQGTDLRCVPVEQTARLDRQRVRQILLNLVSNALRATPDGTVTLTVEDVGDTWRFAVQDDGCGMSPDLLNRLFSPFRQGKQRTAAQRVGGTGLGLTISQLLARRMRGNIEVTSELGVGSRFVLCLPKEVPGEL